MRRMQKRGDDPLKKEGSELEMLPALWRIVVSPKRTCAPFQSEGREWLNLERDLGKRPLQFHLDEAPELRCVLQYQ